ncbi:MAG: SMC-Scp complex subunit ScpB [Defluviitaleaceae bacterium]|nr:SMC-Scp complex subunit ScpB [Defluviitaleaceae bacterium]
MKQEKALEALLFASGESANIAKLADAIGCDIPMTRNLLANMADTYKTENAGIMLIEMDDSYQLCANPEYNEQIRKLLNTSQRKPITQPLLETLSIVAYKQPVTKNMIEDIRGVNADHAVNRLLEYGLIEERGRLDAPGKPILFATSENFLRFYGLRNLSELFETADAGGATFGEPPETLHNEVAPDAGD